MVVFAAAPRPKSMLTITSLERGDIKVVIDGRRFEPRDNSMRLYGLQPGRHAVTIYREVRGGFFNLRGRMYERVFTSSIHVRPNRHLSITVNRNGRTILREAKFNNGNSRRNYPDYRAPRDQRDRDYRNREVWGDDFEEGRDFEYDVDGRDGDYEWDDRGNARDVLGPVMNGREFDRVLESIDREWLESNKMKSVTQIVSTHYFTSAQVKDMMGLFTIESNKLDLAKMAYAKTVDKHLFLSTVDDAFTFNGSRDELARFIRNSR